MDIPDVRENIARARAAVGWVYPELKWLSGKEAVSANRERNELLGILAGNVSSSFFGNKIHIGELSPGCSLCGRGHVSCLFINGLCTANCFYCPQDRKIKKERLPSSDRMIFDDPREYAARLEKLNYKGVGFSGGEPLLVFDKLLEYIGTLRTKFGKKFYLWLYTNGDLADAYKLKKLGEAGLDEIRFDISAGKYDLRHAAAAVGRIKTVTVEIPAIPEDLPILKKCLPDMRKLGIEYLNLHQLTANKNNYKNYAGRGYTFLHYPDISVFESEMAALRFMCYAIDRGVGLKISYCSTMFKSRLQRKGARQRLGPGVKEAGEELTRAGYIRRLSVHGSTGQMGAIAAKLRRHGRGEWALNSGGMELMFNASLLKEINTDKHPVTIRYFEPCLMARNEGELDPDSSVRPSDVSAGRRLVSQKDGVSALAMECFLELYVERVKESEVLARLFKRYDLKTGRSLADLRADTEGLLACKEWEFVEAGFPRVY